jgi:hypothetical protein
MRRFGEGERGREAERERGKREHFAKLLPSPFSLHTRGL